MTNGSSNDYVASSMNYARNRRKNTKGNVMKYLIPGLKNIIDIPFPDRKLPVCKRCKKIYKTRELCRVRDGHTDVPWNVTYLCVTLDDSCFDRESKGDLRLVEEDSMQFVARSLPGPPMPFRAKKGHIGGAKAPICMACKDKNYTRHHCREKQKHQQLPWGTVYVLMSAIPRASENGFPRNIGCHTQSMDYKRPASNMSMSSSCSSGHEDASASKRMKGDECSTATSDTSANPEDEVVASDDIHMIESTRAFLMTINKDHSCVLRWLEVDPFVPRSEYDSSWGNQCENVDQLSAYQPTPKFGSNAYPPPPAGWSGYGNNNRNREQRYTPKLNGSMGGGPPKMPSNHNSEFNGPHSQSPYNHFEQYISHFPGMQPHAMNSSYRNNANGRNPPIYSEDENCTRSNLMHHSMRRNLHPQHHHEGFNRYYQSHSELGPNSHGQYRNQEYRVPGPSHSPPSQSGPFHCTQRPSPPNRSSHGQSASFYQSNRCENYHNNRCEEQDSAGGPPMHHLSTNSHIHQQPSHNAILMNPYSSNSVKNRVAA